jgi:hypothetical protein
VKILRLLWCLVVGHKAKSRGYSHDGRGVVIEYECDRCGKAWREETRR